MLCILKNIFPKHGANLRQSVLTRPPQSCNIAQIVFQEYQKVLKEADDLMNILAGVLPKEKYTLLDQFDSAKNGVACFCADAAYEQGIKDAFAIMRSFIL